jgi:hypothetical protein
MNAMEIGLKALGFGRSPIFALTPVPATASLREAALEVGCLSTKWALSDDRFTVLELSNFFFVYDKRLAGSARFASEYVTWHCGGILSSATAGRWPLNSYAGMVLSPRSQRTVSNPAKTNAFCAGFKEPVELLQSVELDACLLIQSASSA